MDAKRDLSYGLDGKDGAATFILSFDQGELSVTLEGNFMETYPGTQVSIELTPALHTAEADIQDESLDTRQCRLGNPMLLHAKRIR